MIEANRPVRPLSEAAKVMSLSRRQFAAALAALGWSAGLTRGAPAPKEKAKPSGVVVLDDSDREYEGKATYEDGLTFLTAAGKVRARVSSLNVCEEIGSINRVAVDAARKRVWVAETVGRRLLQYDLDGKELLVVLDVEASGLAVDPATGNLWAAIPPRRLGGGSIAVYDLKGKRLAEHKVASYDLAYDPKSKAIWATGQKLTKVSLDGKVLAEKEITIWNSVSVAVNGDTGDVWTVSRRHPQVVGSKNALFGFDNAGKPRCTVELGDTDEMIPFKVAVNPRDGSVWLANFRRSLLHFDAKGKRIAEHKIKALTVAVNTASNNVWVVTEQEVLDVDPKGKVVGRTPLKAKTSQAWVAAY